MLKKLWYKCRPNPLDRQLKRAANKGFKSALVTWNRGMGDVPLGLYAVVHRIRTFLQRARIVFVVRQDLVDAFSLLEGVEVYGAANWKRGIPFDLPITLKELGLDLHSFDLILENPDPTHWVKWQLGTLVPKLLWNSGFDALADNFSLQGSRYVALHVHTETKYGYEKNWPAAYWRELAERLIHEKGAKILLFGLHAATSFEMENVIDLRGKTTLFEMLSLLKNRCSSLIAPDSGILSIIYYLNASFPLRIVSLWADPRQGVLKQNVASPNPELEHLPLLGEEEKIENITVEKVLQTLALDILDPLLLKQRNRLCENKTIAAQDYHPLKHWTLPPSKKEGISFLQRGKVGCLILAGGQGSRLGLHLPKGLVPVTAVKGKTLLQYFCEKTKAASLQAETPLPLAIMTSPLNHSVIVDYIKNNGRFGLDKEQVFFFPQNMLPFLDNQGHWVPGAGGKIALGPDGNGSALSCFYRSQIFHKWAKLGIEHVHVIPIDNPLADPFDASLIAAHVKANAEISLKSIPRTHPQEKVGMLALHEGKIRVLEYSELPEEAQHSPEWHLAHTGMFCFSMPFIEKTAGKCLPWHVARKGGLFKFETFLFDLLIYAEKVEVLLYPRNEVYAPLKNATGEASIETVQTALMSEDRRIFHSVSGTQAPERMFELDPIFHYPTIELLKKWQGKQLPDSEYIESLLN